MSDSERPEATDDPAAARRTLVTISLASTVSVLPVWMVAAMGGLIREDLHFGEARLGLLVSAYFGAAAFASIPGGRLTERVGYGSAMKLALASVIVSCLGIALVAQHWTHVAFFLALSGVASGIVQPAADFGLARSFPARRRGIGFGIKQASVPLGTMIAGLAVPVVGLTLGWRWALAMVVPLAAAVFAAMPPRRPQPKLRRARSGSGDARLAGLVVMAVAGGAAVASNTALTAFFVESAVASGIPVGTAGKMLALGSIFGLIARVGSGWAADHRPGRELPTVTALLVVGAAGMLLIAAGGRLSLLVVATILAFGAGWGWNGLFAYAIVRANPASPGVAAGITIVGIRIGGVLGPATFGLLSQRTSYAAAWSASAAALLFSAVLIAAAGRRSLAPTAKPARCSPAYGEVN